MKTKMFVCYWNAAPDRIEELNRAIEMNRKNPDIDELIILHQHGISNLPHGDKISHVAHEKERASYEEIFSIINSRVQSPDDISIFANTDCFFIEGDLAKIKPINFRPFVFTITRWDVDHALQPIKGCKSMFNGRDAWVFKGKIRPMKWLDFYPGCHECDWHLDWLLRHAGYQLANPYYDVRLWHYHPSDKRTYGPRTKAPGHKSIGVCRYIFPSRLSDLPNMGQPISGLIAYSLYGSKSMYMHGALINAEMIRHIYPGFTARFYVADDVPNHVIERLIDLNCEIIRCGSYNNCEGTLWRLQALEDPGYDVVCIRDVDSRLSYRERVLFDQWLKSGHNYHAVRDHPYHNNAVILCYFNSRKPIKLPERTDPSNVYGVDERYFQEQVYPLICNEILVHDTFKSGNTEAAEVRETVPLAEFWHYYVGAKIWEDSGYDPATCECMWKTHEETPEFSGSPFDIQIKT